ncbi:MAG: hypothetical protein ACI8W7_004488 [Gammaproteobacteria bacterium]
MANRGGGDAQAMYFDTDYVRALQDDMSTTKGISEMLWFESVRHGLLDAFLRSG